MKLLQMSYVNSNSCYVMNIASKETKGFLVWYVNIGKWNKWWFGYLNCKRINSLPSCISFKPGETLISTQPAWYGAWCTMLSKKSDKTSWSRIWSPYRDSVFISSGISWKSFKFLSFSKIMTWLTMASKTFPNRNSSTFSCSGPLW